MTTDDMHSDRDACITLAHGAGGRQTAALIARVFAHHFQNPDFTADDAAILPVGTFATGRAAFTRLLRERRQCVTGLLLHRHYTSERNTVATV